MKCPECSGNNGFEIGRNDDDGEEFETIIYCECYDCGATWEEDISEYIDTLFKEYKDKDEQ